MSRKIIKKKHKKAMDLAELAFIHAKNGNSIGARELYSQAYELEKRAALLSETIEPSRSILFRSAASLAIDIKYFREAEKMIAFALAGNPPDEIADELRDLLWICLKKLKKEPAGKAGLNF